MHIFRGTIPLVCRVANKTKYFSLKFLYLCSFFFFFCKACSWHHNCRSTTDRSSIEKLMNSCPWTAAIPQNQRTEDVAWGWFDWDSWTILENEADKDQPTFAVSQEWHQLQPWKENLNAKEGAIFLFETTDSVCFWVFFKSKTHWDESADLGCETVKQSPIHI